MLVEPSELHRPIWAVQAPSGRRFRVDENESKPAQVPWEQGRATNSRDIEAAS